MVKQKKLEQRPKKKKSIFPKIFMILFFMMGLGIFMYPILSNLYANFYHTRVIDSYTEKVNSKSKDEKTDVIKDMMQYNKEMATGEGAKSTDPFKKEAKKNEPASTKHKVLDALDKKLGEVLGYITIPEISAKLPMYSGTSDIQLQKGIGVLEGTSLPIGGEGTHSVLTGHRGLPSSKLFTDLPNLKIGDKFFIDILDETHEYKVDQIKVVEPQDTTYLQLVPGKDYITLLTCTPYMVNTHRLLVRGVRVPLKEKDKKGKDMNGCDCDCLIPLIILIVICFLILILLWRIYRIMKREENERKAKKEEQEKQEKQERSLKKRKKRKAQKKAIDS